MSITTKKKKLLLFFCYNPGGLQKDCGAGGGKKSDHKGLITKWFKLKLVSAIGDEASRLHYHLIRNTRSTLVNLGLVTTKNHMSLSFSLSECS